MLSRLLVGVDGSDGSRRAVAFASHLARNIGARLCLMHVVEPMPVAMAATLGMSTDECHRRQLAEGHRVLEEVATELGLAAVETLLEIGRPPEALCAAAEDRDADMIVVGAQGHGGYRLMPGSVGSRVVTMSSRTVTVVR